MSDLEQGISAAAKAADAANLVDKEVWLAVDNLYPHRSEVFSTQVKADEFVATRAIGSYLVVGPKAVL